MSYETDTERERLGSQHLSQVETKTDGASVQSSYENIPVSNALPQTCKTKQMVLLFNQVMKTFQFSTHYHKLARGKIFFSLLVRKLGNKQTGSCLLGLNVTIQMRSVAPNVCLKNSTFFSLILLLKTYGMVFSLIYFQCFSNMMYQLNKPCELSSS